MLNKIIKILIEVSDIPQNERGNINGGTGMPRFQLVDKNKILHVKSRVEEELSMKISSELMKEWLDKTVGWIIPKLLEKRS